MPENYNRLGQMLILLMVTSSISCVQEQTNELQVGVASASITPAAGAFIAGDKNNRRFTGVHDSLYVKAIVLADTGNTLALLTFDCIGMLYPTLVEIRKAVAAKIPSSEFDPSHIVMASTHTHSGPDVVGIWGKDQMTSGIDTEYMNNIVYVSTEAIVSAWKSKRFATARYAETVFGKNWVYNISDSLNLDRSLTMLQFLDKKGKSIATLTNFACHPTIMDGATSLVSADYVSALYTKLDQTLGGVNFFLQGAIGGWVQPEYENKNFETAAKRGGELGAAVETALLNPAKLNNTLIQFSSKIINLPVSNESFRQLSAAEVIKRPIKDSVSTEIAWFSVGNAQFVTHPGETSPTYSLESKKIMQNKGPKFIIGLGNDALGYILPNEFYAPNSKVKHVGYLTGMSIGKETGPILMQTIKELAVRH